MRRIIAALLLIAFEGLGSQARAHQSHHPDNSEKAPAHHQHHESMGSHWMAPRKEQKRRNPLKANKASIQQGQVLFREHCVSCHGESGEGNGPAAIGLTTVPANLKEMVSFHTDGDLAWKIAEGRGAMPGWKTQLKSRDIWHLVNYLKQLPRQ